jgi:hypothetical protein
MRILIANIYILKDFYTFFFIQKNIIKCEILPNFSLEKLKRVTKKSTYLSLLEIK